MTTDFKKPIKSDERFYILVPTEENSCLPIKINYSSNPGSTFVENSSKKQNIAVFSKFTNLEELCLGNDVEERLENKTYNRFYGSLKSLKNLTKLNKLQIEVTRIKEVFEYLSGNFQIISWYKQNEMIAKTIPLERLYLIRGMKKSDDNVRWYKKLFAKQGTDNLSELSKLETPNEIDENYGAIGGGILGIYPFAELAVSNMEKSREDRKNNYNELLGILSQFKESGELKGTVNEALKNLKEKNEDFLNDGYDEDNNREIDIEELKKNLSKFTQELNKENNKIQAIADNIKKLEEAIIKYRKFSYYGEIEKEVKDNLEQKIEKTELPNVKPKKSAKEQLATLSFTPSPKKSEGFGKHQLKSLQATARLVKENGTQVFTSLAEVANYLNSQQELIAQIELRNCPNCQLNAIVSLEELASRPGDFLHKLKGNRKGQ
ncbi:6046_t:CDS:2 [Funneliformis geosporum]|nr:6046_t:CDS:2 [Funneliformis geosporum]